MGDLWMWVGFNCLVLLLISIDLFVFHRNSHEVKMKEALTWSAVWITLAMIFNVGVYVWFGQEAALQFFTGYIIEKSLSVDNLFVFLMVFAYFRVPPKYQHKVLFWGIIGALVMRAILIVVGAALIAEFHWIIYIFGGFLVLTGIRMAFQEEENINPEKNIVIRIFRAFFPVSETYHEDRFIVRHAGKLIATPLLLVLVSVEFTDLVFALDSIPAIFAITPDPFIIYTSNVFAILGLRALYFALSGVMNLFYYLKFGLAAVLVFVGTKMVIIDFYKIPIGLSLGVVATILVIAVVASLLRQRRESRAAGRKSS
ncbi:MAG: TerC family protein [Candidatus Kapaibacterium sp.]